MPSGLNKEWLAQLRAEGKLSDEPHAMVRGMAYAFTLRFAADFSADAFAAGVRLTPDANAGALEDFSVTVGAYASGVTPVTFQLTSTQVNAMPADGDLDGLAWVLFEVLHTPSGENPYRIAGGEIPVAGAVA